MEDKTIEKVERKLREMEDLNDPKMRVGLFTKYLMNQELEIKNSRGQVFSAIFKQFSKDTNQIAIESNHSTFLVGSKVQISKLLKRLIIIDCTVKEVRPNFLFVLQIDRLQIATKERNNQRIIPPAEYVWANNLRTSRSLSDFNFQTIPTVVKINFSDYEAKLKTRFDYVKIDVFRPDLEDKFFIVRNSGKSIFIENTQIEESYGTMMEDEFVNVEEEMIGEINELMKDYRNKKIVSEVIIPVMYINQDSSVTSIGYVQIQSRTRPLDLGVVMEVKALTFEMIDKIRDSNSVLYKTRCDVINISRDGMRIRVVDSGLIRELPNHPGFSFDIYFKLQAPIPVYGTIRFQSKQTDSLILGVELSGFQPADKKRYAELFESLAKPKRLFTL
jgi:hypothetical protein